MRGRKMGEINSKSTKAEMLEAYKQVKAKLNAIEAMKEDPRKEIAVKEAKKVYESANKIVEKGILSDEIVNQYNDLKTEVARMEKQIKDLYGIEAEANSLVAMINASKEKKVDLEDDYKNRKAELEAELNVKKETLQAEIDDLVKLKEESLEAIRTQNKAEMKDEELRRKREEEEYNYTTKRNRQKENDKWADEKAAREKELASKEASVREREENVAKQEAYILGLEEKVSEIPILVENAKADGVAKGKADADKSNVFEVRALKKEHEYKENTLENKIKMLEGQLAAVQSANEILQNKLDSAYAQMRELAATTVASTGGVKIISGEVTGK